MTLACLLGDFQLSGERDTHTSPFNFSISSQPSFSPSSSISKTISVPHGPKVFPLGSFMIVNASPPALLTKLYCSGVGFSGVGGGRDEIVACSVTR